MSRFIYFSLLIVLSPFSHAGWVSSGGELIGDSQNPWWIQNKKVISYCVTIDHESISGTESDIRLVVRKSFENWLTEWRYFFKTKEADFQLGDQTLNEVSCNEPVDITFYFGWNSLDKEKQKKIANSRDPKSIVGLAVRTEYDPVQLMGKGFIFINSDQGEHKFESTEKLYPRPWRHKALLSFALGHELGHVFGVQHSNQFETLMREDFLNLFLDVVVQIGFWKQLDSVLTIKYFSQYQEYFSEVDSEKLKKQFKLPKTSILKLVPVKTDLTEFEIYKISKNKKSQLTHRLKINGSQVKYYGLNVPAIKLFLPPQQTVYPKDKIKSSRFYVYSDYMVQSTGTLESVNGNKTPVILDGSREYLSLKFLVDNKFQEVSFGTQLLRKM